MYREIVRRFQEVQYKLSLEAEFDREDFTVVAQPMLLNTILPVTSEGKTDETFFGVDCFHFSQKSHSASNYNENIKQNRIW